MIFKLKTIPLRTMLPHILVLCWVVFLGLTIWVHTNHSTQPPLYDPLGYFQKSLNFWQGIMRGDWINPFNIAPTSRPPGTILLSAPFGYTTDFHGFYFRSVFFPIVCVVVSVYISAGRVQIMAARWGVAVIALLFSSLTMFYHFEFVENICSPVRFGLVDNFQAGIAAIASATFIRSLATSSVRVLFVGIIMASFTVLIKPSGGAVMALLGMSWVVFVSLEWFHFRHCLEISKKLRRYLVLGSMQLFAVYLVITVVCVKSQYLSSENFLFAKQALATMKDELAIDFSQIPLLLHISMGEAIFFWIIGVTVLFIFFCCRSGDLRKRNFFKMSGFLLFASIFWAGGIFFWLVVQVGGSQVRYFHPFFLMGIVCLVPLAVYVWLKSNKWIQFALLLICVLPAGNMALLLMQKNPPLGWQRLTGVSLLVGTNDAVVKEAYNFLEIVRREKCNARIYSFSTELPVAIFESVGMYEGVVNPDSLTFNILRPVDWVRGFVVRVNDLLLSNYICFEPLKEDEVNAMMGLEQIQSFNDENRVFRAWFSMLTEKDGIEIISNSPVCLLEIGDISLFERRIEQFISSRTWRSEFKEANPRRWWSDSEVSSYILSNKSVAKEIEFGDLYRLHVMTISCLGEKIKIEFWWEALRDDDKSWERRMFFHFIDSEAKIRSQQSVSLDGYKPPSPQRRWRYGAVEFDPSIDAEISALAFGVWHPDRKVGLLTADKGVRDWNDRRVLIPLNVERPVK